MIKTVFFDLDNVIFNEDLLYFKHYEILWMFLRKQDWRWIFDRLIEEREFLVGNYNDPNAHLTIARKYLTAKELQDYKNQIQYFTRKHRNKYIKIIPGMQYVIRNLAHGYHLGIIANQSGEDYDFLTNFKLSLLFRTVAISSKLKYSKPNPEIFLWALQQSKTNPEEAVMVGDRWDLDILPARRLGMNTVQVSFDYKTKGIFPQSNREKLYFDSLERVHNWSEKSIFQKQVPSVIANNPQGILVKIQEFEEQPTAPSELDLEERSIKEEGGEEKSWWDILKEIMGDLSEPPP